MMVRGSDPNSMEKGDFRIRETFENRIIGDRASIHHVGP